MKTVAIIGHGFVGKGMKRIFPDAFVIDPPAGLGAENQRAQGFDLAIVCVPTPMLADGRCDTSAVCEVVETCEAERILIKSTVSPETTSRLVAATGKRVCFSPEYMGESRYWTPAQFPAPGDPLSHGFMIIGGEPADRAAVADLFLPRLGPATRFRFMTSTEAELVKYFENSYFALKVTFANEIRRVCEAAGVCYHTVREGWLDDPRVGAMHSAAFADKPGFDGKCLPKDTAALAAYCRALGAPSHLLEAVLAVNGRTGP